MGELIALRFWRDVDFYNHKSRADDAQLLSAAFRPTKRKPAA